MEMFKTIERYPNYQISNLGRVKSFNNGKKGIGNYARKETILKPALMGHLPRKYLTIGLCKNGKRKTTAIHRLVGLYFVDNPDNLPVLNHLDNDPLNNNHTNLEWTTNRANTNHGYTFHKTTSIYPGVCWSKRRNKWETRIIVNGKRKHLGMFTNELEAAAAYQNTLNTL